MEKFRFFLIVFLFVFFGCSENSGTLINDDDDDALEDVLAEEAEEFDEASVLFVPREELPEWLCERIDCYIEDYIKKRMPGKFVRIKKGEWEDRTVYTIEESFGYTIEQALNINVIGIFYENGKQPPCINEDCALNESETKVFMEKFKDWDVIFKFYNEFLTKSSVTKWESTDKYVFPDISGMNDWERPTIIKDRLGPHAKVEV